MENEIEYKVCGFEDYTVTSGGKVFRLRHFKHKTDRVEVHEDVQGLVSLYQGSKRIYRCQMVRLIAAATMGLDPRDKAVEKAMKDKLLNAYLPNLSQQFRDADTDEKRAMVTQLVAQSLMAVVPEKNQMTQTIVDQTAAIVGQMYRLTDALNRSELINTEISREGNERVSANPLMKEQREYFKVLCQGLQQLGCDYRKIQHNIEVVGEQQQRLFDDSSYTEYELV